MLYEPGGSFISMLTVYSVLFVEVIICIAIFYEILICLGLRNDMDSYKSDLFALERDRLRKRNRIFPQGHYTVG